MKTKAKKQAARREAAKQQEALKQEAKKKASRRIGPEPCLYCGRPTLCRDFIVNPGAEHELPCCGEKCFDRAREFIEYDRHRRGIFYLLLFVFVVANLFLLGFETAARWKYLPMLGLALSALVYPLIFTRYERYQKFGIKKTEAIIRIVAGTIAAFALLLIITNSLG